MAAVQIENLNRNARSVPSQSVLGRGSSQGVPSGSFMLASVAKSAAANVEGGGDAEQQIQRTAFSGSASLHRHQGVKC